MWNYVRNYGDQKTDLLFAISAYHCYPFPIYRYWLSRPIKKPDTQTSGPLHLTINVTQFRPQAYFIHMHCGGKGFPCVLTCETGTFRNENLAGFVWSGLFPWNFVNFRTSKLIDVSNERYKSQSKVCPNENWKYCIWLFLGPHEIHYGEDLFFLHVLHWSGLCLLFAISLLSLSYLQMLAF